MLCRVRKVDGRSTNVQKVVFGAVQEGVLLAWRSADPVLQVQEVGGALAGRIVVSIAAGSSPRSSDPQHHIMPLRAPHTSTPSGSFLCLALAWGQHSWEQALSVLIRFLLRC